MDPIIPSKPNPVANKFAHALELATGHWPLPIGRTSFRHSRPATLCRGFREGDSVHRLQASLHSRGRPSAPCKADLYYRGALKRHSEAHPMAFVGYVWMPSCQMPSCQIESMGEFIGHCHILRINTWILSPPLKLTSRQKIPPCSRIGNWAFGDCQFDGFLFHIPAKRRSGAASVAHLGRARTREGTPSDARGANLYSRNPLKRHSDVAFVARFQANSHNGGRPSAPGRANLYQRDPLKRHSEAHPVTPSRTNLHNMGRPSTPGRANLCSGGLLKRHSSARSVAPVG